MVNRFSFRPVFKLNFIVSSIFPIWDNSHINYLILATQPDTSINVREMQHESMLLGAYLYEYLSIQVETMQSESSLASDINR